MESRNSQPIGPVGIVLLVTVLMVNFMFCIVSWFTFLFGGSPQNGTDKLNFIVAGIMVSALPNFLIAPAIFFLKLSKNQKIGTAFVIFLPQILFGIYHSIRLLS